MESPKAADVAHIGRSVIIKGELSGSEDLYVDGQVEGTIQLQGNSLTVGPNGQVRANVNARNVSVHGKLEGNVRASERIELTKSAVVIGDVFAQRVAIEDGAYFKGKVDIQKEAPKAAAPVVVKPDSPATPAITPQQTGNAAAVAAPAGSATGSAVTGGTKTPVTEQKKF